MRRIIMKDFELLEGDMERLQTITKDKRKRMEATQRRMDANLN
jgi:hypothetical protein